MSKEIIGTPQQWEQLEKELNNMSDTELMEAYINF